LTGTTSRWSTSVCVLTRANRQRPRIGGSSSVTRYAIVRARHTQTAGTHQSPAALPRWTTAFVTVAVAVARGGTVGGLRAPDTSTLAHGLMVSPRTHAAAAGCGIFPLL